MQEDKEDMGNDIKILTFTGASGSGKTTIVKELLSRNPSWKNLPSLTSREQRSSDLENEHTYGIPRNELEENERNGELLWLVEAHGNLFGTSKEDVDVALKAPYVSLSILKPECIASLKKYAGEGVLSFYILSPKEDVLRKRLEERREHSKEEIEERIAECKKWDEEAKNSGIPYTFITNDGTVDELVEQVMRLL